MQEQDYLKGAIKTFNAQGNVNDINHLILGVVSEVGEVIDLFKKHIGYRQEKNEEWLRQLELELGDAFWYTTILQHYLGGNISIFAEGSANYTFDEMKCSNVLLKCCSELLEFNHSSMKFTNSIHNIVAMLNFVAFCHGIEMEDVLTSNLAKLQKRHGEKFNEKANMESGRNRKNEEV